MNETPEILRLRMALHTRGVGVTLFALWSFIKIFLICMTSANTWSEGVAPEQMWIMYIITFILVLVIGGIDITIRLYIGRSAISFSRGGRFRRISIILAGLLILVDLSSVVVMIIFAGQFTVTADTVVSFLVDVIIAILYLEVIVLSLRLRKMEA